MKSFLQVGVFEKKEEYAKVVLSKDIYPLPTIYAAAYAFLDKAFVLLDEETKGKIAVFIFPKDAADPKMRGKEFCNELINYAHYFTRAESNAAAIKTIMQRVLFSVNPKFAEEAEEMEIQQLLKDLEKEEPPAKKKKK
jgi:His-Xaa-Ser system protein HxsD